MNIDWVDMKKPKMRIGTKNHLLQTLAGDSDFRKLSILLIITWFPFPIWFSLSRAPQGLPPAMVSPSSQKARNFTICYHLSYVGYVGFCWIYKLIVHSPYIFPHLIHIYIYISPHPVHPTVLVHHFSTWRLRCGGLRRHQRRFGHWDGMGDSQHRLQAPGQNWS